MIDRKIIIIGIIMLLFVLILVGIYLWASKKSPINIQCSPICSKDQKCIDGICTCNCGSNEYCDIATQHCFPKSLCGDRKIPSNADPKCSLDSLICPADDPRAEPDWPKTWRCSTPCDSSHISYPTHKDGCKFEDLVCGDDNGWICPSDKNTYCNEQGFRILKNADTNPQTACICKTDYNGSTCQYSKHSTCNDSGTPNTDGTCTCNSISWGTHCENHCGINAYYKPVEDGDCHGHGQHYNCSCTDQTYHRICETETCELSGQCCGHGHVDGNTCVCDPGYSNKQDSTCCIGCKNGGTMKPDGTCDCSTAVIVTSDSINDCTSPVPRTIYKVTYFSGPDCSNGLNCYNKIGDDHPLGIDSSNNCICPPGSCGKNCEINKSTCSCHGDPCKSNPPTCIGNCDQNYEGDNCKCYHPAIQDIDPNKPNLADVQVICKNENMFGCSDSSEIKPLCLGGAIVDNYCEIKPTSCGAWQEQMAYIAGGPGKYYDCSSTCAKQGGHSDWGNLVCNGSPPNITCQKQCLPPTDPIAQQICNSCNKDTQWCVCDGVGDPHWEWRCEDIYNIVNKNCVDKSGNPQSCCPPRPDYMDKYCPKDASVCMDCGPNKDGYGLFWYCEGLTKMPKTCASYGDNKSGGIISNIYGGQLVDVGNAPIYPVIDNDQCTANQPSPQLITDKVNLFPFGEFWSLYGNQTIPGHVSKNPTPTGTFTPYDPVANFYYPLPGSTSDISCLIENPCNNHGTFRQYCLDTSDPPKQAFCDTLQPAQISRRLSTGTCPSCHQGYFGPVCQYSRNDTCSGHGEPDFNGNCTCDAGYDDPRCSTYHACNGHGTWNHSTQTCDCSPDQDPKFGWIGANCEQRCANTCDHDVACSGQCYVQCSDNRKGCLAMEFANACHSQFESSSRGTPECGCLC